MITVRRATLEDKPAIVEFIRSAYQSRWKYKFPERWHWEFVDNPFLDGEGLPVFIAVDDYGIIVGQTCTLVEPLKLGDKLCRVGWGVDSFVLPEHRGKGIGFQLQKANDEYNEIFMSLDMAPTNRRIKQRLGAVAVEPVPIYYRLAHHPPEEIVSGLAQCLPGIAPWLAKMMRWDRAGDLGGAVKDALLSLRDRQRLGKPAPDLSVEAISSFGEEFNRLWVKVSPSFYAIVRREAVFLNWKYVQQPFLEYHRFAIRRQGEVCGYLVLRLGRPPEPNLGIIADLFIDPRDQEAMHILLAHAVRFFKEAGVKDILTATSVQLYGYCLEKLGFHRIGEALPMFHCRTAGLGCTEAVEPGRWFLGKSDHDWDQYPLAR